MSVHKAISSHVNKQNAILVAYANLDREREMYIEEAILQYDNGLPVSTDKINSVTVEMNRLSNKIENLPTRKLVTIEMIAEYVNKQK